MAQRNPAKFCKTATRVPAVNAGAVATRGPLFLFLLTVGASAGMAAYASRAISPDALLPIMSGILFVSAAVLAALGWKERKAMRGKVTVWDVAGALTLIGCAAAALSEPEEVMQVIGLRFKN